MFDIDPERVDGVRQPASGLPILLMKALDAPEPTPAAASETDATKEVPVPEVPEVTETPAAVVPEADKPAETVEKSLAELVKEEVAKAVETLSERNKALEDEMAALKSLPIPGGPAITAPAATRDRNAQAHQAAEAARFRRLAKEVGDQDLVLFYEAKAKEVEAASKA
jgi:hypothetical protein